MLRTSPARKSRSTAANIFSEIWEEEGPPRGTNYNYPPRKDAIASLAGYPAPLKIGAQMKVRATLMKMIAKVTQQGQSFTAMSWAEDEIDGFMRS